MLFIQDDIILKLPSFKKSDCQVVKSTEFPGPSYGVTGLVSNTLHACYQTSCWKLNAGVWTNIDSMMSVPRDGDQTAWAASNSPKGWMVTGGNTMGNTNSTDSTEVFNGVSWAPEPTLPYKIHGHCQVQAAETETVYVIGNTSIKL